MGRTPSGDKRAFYNWHISQISPVGCSLLMYPRVFPVGNTEDGAIGEWQRSDGEDIGFVRMPQPLSPSMESLQDDGIYLIDDGLEIYLYAGKLVPRDIVEDITSSDGNTRIREMVKRLSWQLRTYSSIDCGSESTLRLTYPSVILVLQKDGHQGFGEAEILSLMVDDATAGEKDYVEFICGIHKRIRDRLQAK